MRIFAGHILILSSPAAWAGRAAEMPILKELDHNFDWPWESVAEAIWKRHANVARFPERKSVDIDKLDKEKTRIDVVNSKAKVYRKVTYDFSKFAANNPFFQGTVGNASDFKMDEELDFDWMQRELIVSATHTTQNGQIKYTEKCVYKVNPENNKQTFMRQTGSSLGSCIQRRNYLSIFVSFL